MSEEKKYPYIGNGQVTTVLFDSKMSGYVLESSHWDIGLYKDTWGERSKFKGITNEHLKNTWGKVESEEHRAMICELAVNGGYVLNEYDSAPDADCFYVAEECFGFHNESYCKEDAKQITLPMPPVDEFKESLNAGIEAAKSEAWPQVGDEVQTSIGKGEVITGQDCDGNYVVEIDGVFNLRNISSIKKPKTAEEELRDEIQRIIDLNTKVNCSASRALMSGFNITRKDK